MVELVLALQNYRIKKIKMIMADYFVEVLGQKALEEVSGNL